MDRHLRVRDEMHRVGRQLRQPHQRDDGNALIVSHRTHCRSREHLRPRLVRSQPRDVNRYRQIAGLKWLRMGR